jgi:hypothetical protein
MSSTGVVENPIAIVFMLIVALVLLIGLPIGLVWRARQGVQHFTAGYYEGRTAGMTPAELQAFERRPPALLKIWPVVVVACLILLCVVIPYASPVVFVIWMARLFSSKTTQRIIRDEYSPVRRRRILDLGDSARERDRGRPDAE